MRLISSVALLGVLASMACGHRLQVGMTPSAPTDVAIDSARRFLRGLVEQERIPGLAITVSVGQANAPVWHEGFGFADVASGTLATPQTQFRIGSVSKLITAAALMRSVEAGLVDLDSPLSRYRPTLPRHIGGVTLRQLAGHAAGIRHYRGSEFLANTAYPSLVDALSVYADDSLVAPPGIRYSYSSYGYNLIGAVLETVTSQSFPELAQRLVLSPLGMKSTGVDREGAAIPARATMYTISPTGPTAVPDDDLRGRWPSGGFLSSTDDMARLGRSMLAPGLVNATSLALMVTPQTLRSGQATAVGIGWRVSIDSAGRQYYHHGGTSNGGAAILVVYPKEQLVIAMASNALAPVGERQALAIAAILLAGAPPDDGSHLRGSSRHLEKSADFRVGRCRHDALPVAATAGAPTNR